MNQFPLTPLARRSYLPCVYYTWECLSRYIASVKIFILMRTGDIDYKKVCYSTRSSMFVSEKILVLSYDNIGN